MKLFTGKSNQTIALEIADHLNTTLGDVMINRFSDGEIWVKYQENIRDEDVFVIQSTNPPAENIIELVLMIDAAVRASAKRVTAVIPYFGYARQDRKDQPRVPISARVIMDMIGSVGAGRILTMDLHSSQIQGFTRIPLDHLYARKVIFERLRSLDIVTKNSVVLAPDIGSARMSQSFAKHLGVEFALIDKRRTGPNETEVVQVVGDLEKRDVIIIDDLIDTAGTIYNAAKVAAEHNAASIVAFATHGIFSGPAPQRLMESPVEKVIVTNTIENPKDREFEKLEIISVGALFAQAIKCIHMGESISALFDF